MSHETLPRRTGLCLFASFIVAIQKQACEGGCYASHIEALLRFRLQTKISIHHVLLRAHLELEEFRLHNNALDRRFCSGHNTVYLGRFQWKGIRRRDRYLILLALPCLPIR